MTDDTGNPKPNIAVTAPPSSHKTSLLKLSQQHTRPDAVTSLNEVAAPPRGVAARGHVGGQLVVTAAPECPNCGRPGQAAEAAGAPEVGDRWACECGTEWTLSASGYIHPAAPGSPIPNTPDREDSMTPEKIRKHAEGLIRDHAKDVEWLTINETLPDDLPEAATAKVAREVDELIANAKIKVTFGAGFPTIVCLCGSTRFGEAFREANLRLTLAGKIVLSIGCDMRSDAEIFAGKSDEELARIKAALDELHRRKIDLADEVLVLNVDGYIGDSTRKEITYATTHGKPVRYLEGDAAAGTGARR